MSDLIIKYGKYEVTLENKEELYQREADILSRQAPAYRATALDSLKGIAGIYGIDVDPSDITNAGVSMVWKSNPGDIVLAALYRCCYVLKESPCCNKSVLKAAAEPFNLLAFKHFVNDKKMDEIKDIYTNPIFANHPVIGAAVIAFFCSQLDVLDSVYSSMYGHILAAMNLSNHKVAPVYAYTSGNDLNLFDEPKCYFLDNWISKYLDFADAAVSLNGER